MSLADCRSHEEQLRAQVSGAGGEVGGAGKLSGDGPMEMF